MKKIILYQLFIIFLTTYGMLLYANDVNVYFGNLHAHSTTSDGIAAPEEAYRYARDAGKMNFLVLTEHNHMIKTADDLARLKKIAQQACSQNFVALYGQEYSTLKTNHANIFNYPLQITKADNNHYKKIFGTVLPDYIKHHDSDIIFAEFNHPDSINNDYGFSDSNGFNGDWDDFVDTMRPLVKLIAIGNGPADTDNKTIVPKRNFDYNPIDDSRVKQWFQYLSHGIYLAPVIDHDTHSNTFGTRVSGRTAVWIKGIFNQQNLLQALSDRHTYATEDMNLRVFAKINENYLPGDILLQSTKQILINLDINDADEPQATYYYELFSGISGSGSLPKRLLSFTGKIEGNSKTCITLPVDQPGTYYIVHLEQHSIDPVNESPINNVWFAPIWTNNEQIIEDDAASNDAIADPNSYMYVGSKNSSIYHYPNCNAVKKIRKENLEYFPEAPSGKKLHRGCPGSE